MSDENKFFRFLWRLIALALATLVLGALAIAGYEQWRIYFHHNEWDKPVGNFTPVPKAAEQNATYRIEDAGVGSFILESGGVRERLLPLKRWEGPPRSYGLSANVIMTASSYDGMYAVGGVNLLILDADTSKSRWMFKGYDRVVLVADTLYATQPSEAARRGEYGAALPPVVAVVLTVRDKDDNHDGKLDEKDRRSFYVYRPGMAAPVKFLTAGLVISTHQIGADKYEIVYEDGKSAFAATYAVADFKLLSREPLPNVPK